AGRGGMGRVWEAVDATLQRPVAIKEMSPDLAADPALRELYLKEARTLATLRHPNIVEIFEILDTPPSLYLALEWVNGKTLQHVLAERRRLAYETARGVLEPVCDALAAAHAMGIVHRDLKPSNIMIGADGRVKLMDFGIARSLGDSGSAAAPVTGGPVSPLTAARTRTLAGTPAYRPPEAVQGLITPAFDVFSLGVCLYEALTGELPFGTEGLSPARPTFTPVSALITGLPPGVDALLARLLEPDVAKRIPDAAAAKAALTAVTAPIA
ncbi:MAG: serine/threonine protein kinase, partial [Elusimicrobia bacterium]|nr:serine/threonine protein kinase [Elusimicrobiota bacterium]